MKQKDLIVIDTVIMCVCQKTNFGRSFLVNIK